MNKGTTRPTSEDVYALYRLLLKREPESEASVRHWLRISPSLEWLVDKFLTCDEFTHKYKNILQRVSVRPNAKLEQLIHEVAKRHDKNELYQPIYGLDYEHSGPIQRECVSRCNLAIEAVKHLPLSNMSVLDVGCNMGYCSFYMSSHFGKVVGLEYDDLLFRFCTELKNVLGLPVVFKKFDFFNNFEQLKGAYDLCLLFSVVHYLVASKGMDRAKETLRQITNMFDYTIIELSSSKDYHYMPVDPLETLSGLDDVECTLLGISEKNERPIYLIRKTKIFFLNSGYNVSHITYRPIRHDSCTRIYHCGEVIIKALPFAYKGNEIKFNNEINAYKILSNCSFIPKFLQSYSDDMEGKIALEKINGIFLNKLYLKREKYYFASALDKAILISKVLVGLATMLKRGLFWNDFSAHNIVISNGEVFLIDFGESFLCEKNDHIAMFSWLLHDLQLDSAKSYETDVYSKIHMAGPPSQATRELRFVAPQNFFDEEVEWIYTDILKLKNITDILSLPSSVYDKIISLSRQNVKLRQPEIV